MFGMCRRILHGEVRHRAVILLHVVRARLNVLLQVEVLGRVGLHARHHGLVLRHLLLCFLTEHDLAFVRVHAEWPPSPVHDPVLVDKLLLRGHLIQLLHVLPNPSALVVEVEAFVAKVHIAFPRLVDTIVQLLHLLTEPR